MRTTWTSWTPDEMQDAAVSEARAGFDGLNAPTRHFIAPLPYYGAYTEYEDHVAGCAGCQEDDLTGCREGERLLTVARIGLGEQHRLAASN